MFSDTYPIKLVENCLWELTGKVSLKTMLFFMFWAVKVKRSDTCILTIHSFHVQHISRTQDDIQLAGSNASAEEADEGTDSASESGVDIILNHRLVETGFGSKKDFTVYLKDYMKKVVKYLEDNDMGDQVADFKTNISKVMKEMLGKFKDLQFYTGMIVISLMMQF